MHCTTLSGLLLLLVLTRPLQALGSVLASEYPGPASAWALPSGTANLPCEIEAEAPGEQLYTVLWYRTGDGEPIYTYDARSVGTGPRSAHQGVLDTPRNHVKQCRGGPTRKR